MSDLEKIAATAPAFIEGLVSELFADDATDNAILLGSVEDGNGPPIQVQLVVTRNPENLMDE